MEVYINELQNQIEFNRQFYTMFAHTREGFQTDADLIVLSANQISSPTAPANHRVTSKYQFEIPS